MVALLLFLSWDILITQLNDREKPMTYAVLLGTMSVLSSFSSVHSRGRAQMVLQPLSALKMDGCMGGMECGQQRFRMTLICTISVSNRY